VLAGARHEKGALHRAKVVPVRVGLRSAAPLVGDKVDMRLEIVIVQPAKEAAA